MYTINSVSILNLKLIHGLYPMPTTKQSLMQHYITRGNPGFNVMYFISINIIFKLKCSA